MATRTAERRTEPKPEKTRRRRGFFWWLKCFFIFGFILAVVAAIPAWLFWVNVYNEAGQMVGSLEQMREMLQVSPSVIKSADHKELYRIKAENRAWIMYQDIPATVINATIAAEDKRFWSHHGVDLFSVGRQVVTNIREGKQTGGASTLSMQLAKRMLTGSQKTIRRKVMDAAIAMHIEEKYAKNEIIELYLNQVYYGSQAYGIKQAADTYFGKPVKKLTIAEAAMLSRCVRRPSDWNPHKNLKKAIENRNAVLYVMDEEHLITKAQYQAAINEPVKLAPPKRILSSKRSYFLDYVLDQLSLIAPEVHLEDGGYTVETTLNTEMQEIADEGVRRFVKNNRDVDITTAAFLVTSREGEILAMVGGYDYATNQFNVISQGRRQPGSSFKPFVYSVALQTGVIDEHTPISNAPLSIRLGNGEYYQPKNSSGHGMSAPDMHEALRWSVNIPAVRVLQGITPSRFVPLARSIFGFSSRLPAVYSLALGAAEVSPIEMAQGYSVFQRGGTRAAPFGIRRILAHDGSVVREFYPNISRSGLSMENVEIINDCLRGVVTGGTGTRASVVPGARGKTGTTNDNKDAWFIGYTNEILGVGWVANETRQKSGRPIYRSMDSSVMGGKYTAILWANIMSKCQRLVKKLDMPEDGSAESIDEGNTDSQTPSDETVHEADTPEFPQEEASDPGPSEQNPAEEPVETPPKPQEPPQDEPTNTEERSNETITVMICADSGQLARDSCPEQVPRTYRKGREPKRLCRQHS
ncbi:MAG: transglycosylase domain-containing protein [Chthonomonas sp.]|nr:transglycosylase domain-containing protein [Chthonomonas sp.]